MSALTIDQIMNFIGSMRPFNHFDQQTIKKIASLLKVIKIDRNTILMHQNDHGNSMYFVFGGHLKTTITNQLGTETSTGEIGQGEIVGEISLILDEPRSATVRAIRDTVLLEFSRKHFDEFNKDYPEAAMSIARFCARGLINKKSFKRTRVTTVAFIPAGENPYFSEFVSQYATALGVIGSTLHLNQKHFQELYSQNSTHTDQNALLDDAKIATWLHEQEDRHSYVIYETDNSLSPWTTRCLKHADRLIFVGHAESKPILNEIENELNHHMDHSYLSKELILLYRTKQQPTETKSWMRSRKLDGHHHVKMGSPKDYSKLIRFFTGNALGIVFGGGGMRGFGYVGLLRALEELRIEFDIVGGCSIGAVVGALYATGYNSKEIHRFAIEFLKKYNSSMKYTLPMLSLMTGNAMWSELHKRLGDTLIEDLWTKFFCVSTNLSKSQLDVYNSGPIWEHVCTSMSIPGILPPTIDQNGDLHVDGGIINNLPIDVMRKQIGSGIVLSAEITSHTKPKYNPIKRGTSGWKILLKRMTHSKKYKNKIPNITEVIVSSLTLAGERMRHDVINEADHLIELDVGQFRMMQTKGIEELINNCYHSSMSQLEKIFNK